MRLRTAETHIETNGLNEPMSKAERVGRIIGGYALGFLGAGTVTGSFLSATPAGVLVGGGVGVGMLYGADRLLRPVHSEWYGEIPDSETRSRKIGRFVTFATSIGVQWLGFGLINNAILPNAWTGANFNFGERVLSGGMGVLGVIGGSAIERVSRRPRFTDSQLPATDNIPVAPTTRFRDMFRREERQPDEDVTADFGARLITTVREQGDRTRALATRSYDRWTDRFPEPRRSELRRNFAQELV